MTHNTHICGFYYVASRSDSGIHLEGRRYLPQVDVSVHSTILATTSRTTLTQKFVNPVATETIPELRYTFPLYDGVSVVGFTCTINKDRIIRGVVKEREEARKTYDQAIAKGQTAGLLEQLPDASDVFTTTIGNVPGGAEIEVVITYLGELKHDAEGEGSIRFTIPTRIAPRYGEYPGQLLKGANVSAGGGIKIIVDAEMPTGSSIKSVQSPSHPISVTIGNTSAGAASGAAMSLQRASATLSLATAELEKDFVVQVNAANTGNPIAILETHPTLPSHRAIMATLVPKFNLPSSRPEIVFICDRSGSMGDGKRIPHLKAALQIFLKSLPLGVKFNICSFGTHHELLFKPGSVSYDASSVDKATKYVDDFAANYGGTEMYQPVKDVIQRRHKDMDLEIFLLTDGQVWAQSELISLVNASVEESKGAIRVFTLGIGSDVSHSLIEGLARAGNGFSQTVMDNEKMNTKVLRMLKASLTPHIKDYTLELRYQAQPARGADDDAEDFEIVEKVMDALTIDTRASNLKAKETPEIEKEPIMLFDPEGDEDAEMEDPTMDTTAGGRYAGVPPVPEPKLLQAPFQIPPLYSFSRTSVYLLLSPETTQKTPSSVLLRATSAHGPLQLEIPITVLEDKGETIHQLAARKSIQELEDGRGWIFHAKDSSDGALLKDKFPGRFSDMVEREAVRLGVKYQVGGKWCSFVAVDGDGEHPPAAAPVPRPRQEAFGHEAMAAPPPDNLYGRGVNYLRGGGGGGGLLSTSLSTVTPSGQLSLPFIGYGYKMAAPQFVAPPFGSAPQSRGIAPLHAPAPAPAPVRMSAPARAPPKRLASKAARKSRVLDERLLNEELAVEDVDMSFPVGKRRHSRACSAGEVSDSFSAPRRGTEPKDPFEAVVALQSFQGSWAWTDRLFGVLAVDGDALCSQVRAGLEQEVLGSDADLSTESDKLATAIVLAWLEVKMQDRRDEWEMMAAKAYSWLEANMADEVTSSYVNAVKELVAKLG
jgi:hypothetical protein